MKKLTLDTLATHAGLKPEENHGIPNPPVYHTSSILRPTLDDHRHNRFTYDYGRIGTPTSRAVEEAVAQIYGADDALALPSGLCSVTTALLAVLSAGDEALFPDSIYGSTRRFVEQILPQNGVKAIFYDPLADSASLKTLITKKTALIYIETPGSLTFEMQDTRAIVSVAKESGCLTACDNTWGTAAYFDAFGLGIDIVIEAGTKYIGGHTDVSIGFVASNGELAEKIRNYAVAIGLCVAPDDLYLALRGLRTMMLRLRRSEENGLHLARWIGEQPEIKAMLHPALASHPQHDLWKRDFTGSCGLFGFVIDKAIGDEAVDSMVDGLALFGIGASWGGFESLIIESKMKRTISPLPDGRLMRIYAGIEDKDDLLHDIKAGFARMREKI